MSIRAPQAIISWSWLPRSLAVQFFLTFFLRYLLNVAKINRHTAPANITPLQKLGVEGKGGRGGGGTEAEECHWFSTDEEELGMYI